jgi:hypothetical protein
MELIVTKIQNEMDGQTLFLEDDKGGQFTTIISPANGNWIDLTIGNRISLVAEEIMESHPAQIISKDIKILDITSPSSIKYEKTEEEIYWVHPQKKEAFGLWEQPISCYQVQNGATLDKNAKWELLCEDIQYFNFVEGKYYQIKVLKKWLENHENLMDRSPYDLELISVLSKEKDKTYKHPIQANLATDKKVYLAGKPINLSLEIKNTGQKPYTFLPWGTPIEDRLTGNCLTIKLNGKEIDYRGIMVKRAPPTEKDYITLQANEAVKGEVNLLDGYQLNAKGIYTIQFQETYKGLPASNIIEIEIR